MRPFFKIGLFQIGLFLDKALGHSLYFGHPSDFLWVREDAPPQAVTGFFLRKRERMNSVVILIFGFLVFFIGYRFYARFIDTRIIKSDPNKATPAKRYRDGVEFMPTRKAILFGYQFKSIAGAATVVGPIIAIQWGWLPALLWILLGAFFIGWVQDYSSATVAVRKDGASFAGLSGQLISPRARIVLLCFIYFLLLLVAGAVKMQQNVLLSVCSFALAGAVAALQGSQECVETMVAEFERRRRVILDGLYHAPDLSALTDPRGAFYVFVRHETPKKDSSALADYLLDHGGVAVVPGTTFGEKEDGCFRISFAASYCRLALQDKATRLNG
jgi:hypothetical protein